MVEESLSSGMPRGDSASPALALIVGAARSGTTLLRLILDSHRDIGCPAEAGLPSLIANLGRVWWTIDADLLGDQTGDPLTMETETGPQPGGPGTNGAQRPSGKQVPDLPAEAKVAIRAAAIAPMAHYCSREGKRVYCDKSLDSVRHVEAVRRIFPGARYVLLFRHVMDTVASGIEASPWGFQAYGYQPFVERSPDNFVSALVSYWVSHVQAALSWQEEHPEMCYRIRYEDLVSSPVTVVSEICAFLGVENDPEALDRAFPHARAAKGPGDYKVAFTSGVGLASIGHGKRVPVTMVPPPLLEAANEKLKVLGYKPVDRSWNAEPAYTDGLEPDLNGWGARLSELVRTPHPIAAQERPTMKSFALVAQDDKRLRWIVDVAAGTIVEGDGEVECVITGTAEDLARLLMRDVNAGVLLRSGRIRHLTGREDTDPGDVIEATRLVLEMLGNGDR
jgi:protein-tyrosine sulfotransferase